MVLIIQNIIKNKNLRNPLTISIKYILKEKLNKKIYIKRKKLESSLNLDINKKKK